MTDIHARIKRARLAKKLSMEALAEAVGVKSWQTVQQWELPDGTAPNRKRLPAVAAALGVTQDYLMTGIVAPAVLDSLSQIGTGTVQRLAVREPDATYLLPDPIDKIVEAAKMMTRDGQMILLGRAQELALQFPLTVKLPLSQ